MSSEYSTTLLATRPALAAAEQAVVRHQVQLRVLELHLQVVSEVPQDVQGRAVDLAVVAVVVLAVNVLVAL